ncbi:hypothetical protein [Streptomyces sp. NPDC057690]|uniref:hypothetical protein n=1 Tax=Streptomyces sp. NPDC057690 TaxID=3346214 RepID=UPI00369DE88F
MLNDALGISDDQWIQALDDTFGPSPEKRAQQEQQGESGGELTVGHAPWRDSGPPTSPCATNARTGTGRTRCSR